MLISSDQNGRRSCKKLEFIKGCNANYDYDDDIVLESVTLLQSNIFLINFNAMWFFKETDQLNFNYKFLWKDYTALPYK